MSKTDRSYDNVKKDVFISKGNVELKGLPDYMHSFLETCEYRYLTDGEKNFYISKCNEFIEIGENQSASSEAINQFFKRNKDNFEYIVESIEDRSNPDGIKRPLDESALWNLTLRTC